MTGALRDPGARQRRPRKPPDLRGRRAQTRARRVGPELVATESITIRFPLGGWEYVLTNRVPNVGDTLVRDGQTWMVARATASVDGHRVITMAATPDAVK